jgi:hypothetical protein
MKLKQEIESLDTRRAEIRFPSPDVNRQFEYWQADLRDIIGTRCGFDVAKTLEFNPFEQRFTVQVSARVNLSIGSCGTGLAADNMWMELQKTVSIYPLGSIAPQIERILLEQSYVNSRLALLQKLLKGQTIKQKKEGNSK